MRPADHGQTSPEVVGAEGGAPLYIGVEGGGTRTTVVVVEADGSPVARVEGGPGLVGGSGSDARLEALASLVRIALQRSGRRPPVEALCCALAGVGREPERTGVQRALERAGLARCCLVTTDAEAAFHDAFGQGPGVLLISGTGSIAWGRSTRGELSRVGGWGILLGDEGSGYAMGLAALRAVVRADDGRDPPTALAPPILAACRVADAPGLIAWSHRAGKSDVAGLAPIVVAAAEAGDDAARLIVGDALTELARLVAALIERLQPWSGRPRVALAGGVLAADSPMRGLVTRALRSLAVAPEVLDREVDGARGAAELARARAPA
jgi:glucosamine kinase